MKTKLLVILACALLPACQSAPQSVTATAVHPNGVTLTTVTQPIDPDAQFKSIYPTIFPR